jgi:NADH:ubiquinone oxidoreductase subunit F (NADH-binding)
MESVLLRARGVSDSRSIATYLAAGGYEGWKKALGVGPDAVVKEGSPPAAHGASSPRTTPGRAT